MQRTSIAIIAVMVAALFAGTSYILLAQQPMAQPSQPSNSQSLNKLGYRDISSEELNTMLAKKDFLLVNVHVPYAGEIKGTDRFIPYNKIPQSIDQLPTDKATKIVVYCRSGMMSATASEELVSLEYTNILNLKGGMIGWEQNGYSLVGK
ncbi:MAG: rhodanese-like domain-containing protein [Thaumarchaeota archaeon]|nr:rhodanese-like domain-containing protein [Nitrososphaerota archaeon]